LTHVLFVRQAESDLSFSRLGEVLETPGVLFHRLHRIREPAIDRGDR
jgi:hypothetical protein